MSLTFLREFARQPGCVGAIWPSSPALARVMVSAANVPNARHVLEIGPGSGAFTSEILTSLAPSARFLAVEKNPCFAARVSQKFPTARIVLGCATNLEETLHKEDFASPDAVVSGLPWAIFPESLQRSILGQLSAVSAKSATFATFAYFGPHALPKGRRFRKLLAEFFPRVERTPVVLNNFPPAFVYVCGGS